MYADHFSIANIPFGIASSALHPQKSIATRLGDDVIFLDILTEHKLLSLSQNTMNTFSDSTLSSFAALPKTAHKETRKALQSLLSEPITSLPQDSTANITTVTMHLPLSIGDFTDFSCSKDHVLNAGEAIMKKRFLPPGFLHFPIGYTGRASSIVVSGTPITRPKGQFRDKEKEGEVIYAPTRELDYELEVACIVGKPSQLGNGVNIEEADEHIFGLVLMNDWSARDIQGLEMPPLGPLNGKSFSTSISPWVITLDALSQFECPAPEREIPVASYLEDQKVNNTYDIHLCAELLTSGSLTAATNMCKSELKSMYWTFRHLLAHQTSNGCCVRTGDLLATGTISGEGDEQHGCLLELTKGGEEAFSVEGVEGGKRVYLEDGDEVKITGWAGEGVGFGECVGVVIPAN